MDIEILPEIDRDVVRKDVKKIIPVKSVKAVDSQGQNHLNNDERENLQEQHPVPTITTTIAITKNVSAATTTTSSTLTPHIKSTQHSSKQKWTSEEDEILVREYHLNPRRYCNKAVKYLPTRSIAAIQKRWKSALCKRYYPSDDVRKRMTHSWSSTEDEIIIQLRKRKKYIRGYKYAFEAAKILQGRSESAVYNRWHNYLKITQQPTMKTTITTREGEDNPTTPTTPTTTTTTTTSTTSNGLKTLMKAMLL